MSSTQLTSDAATKEVRAVAVAMRLEVVVLPVADADRAKAFYASLGWREDADFVISNDYRVLQFTPPGSSASIVFGTGITDAAPGSIDSLVLVVDDIDAARAELVDRGVEVSGVFHDAGGGLGGGFHAGTEGRAPGPDPERRSYGSYASFSDPDGNGWLLQGITQRLPGRVQPMDVASLAQLLHETGEQHDPYEKASPPHDWWDWYAAYFEARQGGATPDEASEIAGRYMADVKHVVAA
jgi:catechol 2,3-dioxygenase-like lactoylglutathione lyase family enzyme